MGSSEGLSTGSHMQIVLKKSKIYKGKQSKNEKFNLKN